MTWLTRMTDDVTAIAKAAELRYHTDAEFHARAYRGMRLATLAAERPLTSAERHIALSAAILTLHVEVPVPVPVANGHHKDLWSLRDGSCECECRACWHAAEGCLCPECTDLDHGHGRRVG